MQPHNQPDSDIDETEMVIQVRCTECDRITDEHIIAESLEDYIPSGDGTYQNQIGICARCAGEEM